MPNSILPQGNDGQELFNAISPFLKIAFLIPPSTEAVELTSA